MRKKCRDDCVDVVTADLSALLFWAAVGVNGAVDGQYSDEIEEVIRFYSEHLGIKTNKAKFRTISPKQHKQRDGRRR
ncbi:MAG: hypothetical protein AAB538_02695 [Patescibacteria group bacterium]